MNPVKAGPKGLPKHSLGWEVLGWSREYLLQPDGPDAGEPWDFTDEQARFILWWYAVDRDGRFIYRSGMLRRMKGWGKDPVGAALCCVEFVGPCRFSHWEEKKPIAKPHFAAWVQTAAVSREQTRNTMTLFPGMLSKKAIAEFDIDLGKEIIYAEHGRKRIEAVTSSPRSLEGARSTFILKNETHHWLAPNEGHEMSKVIARNAAKSRDGASRVLAISNAHAPGEDSDAEHDYEAYLQAEQGLSGASDILYDSLEAPALKDLDDDEAILRAIDQCRGDSHWVQPDRILAEIRDPRTTAAMARRFYLNQIIAEEDKPFDRDRFKELTKVRYKPERGAFITLGFDGSINRDHTALIATEVSTGHQWVAGYWEPEIMQGGDVQIPYVAVDETVREMFERYSVWRMLADPFGWKDSLVRWAGEFGADKVLELPSVRYRQIATMLAGYAEAIRSGHLSHDGDARFVAAIANSHKHMQTFRDDKDERMWTIQKERPDSPLKIDAAIAGCYSWTARQDAIAAGAQPQDSVYEGRGLLTV